MSTGEYVLFNVKTCSPLPLSLSLVLEFGSRGVFDRWHILFFSNVLPYSSYNYILGSVFS